VCITDIVNVFPPLFSNKTEPNYSLVRRAWRILCQSEGRTLSIIIIVIIRWTAKFIRIIVSWVVTPRRLVDKHQNFGGICCLHFEARRLTLLPGGWKHLCQRLEPISELPGVTIHMTVTFIPSIARNSARHEYLRPTKPSTVTRWRMYLSEGDETVAATLLTRKLLCTVWYIKMQSVTHKEHSAV